jgi:hypothetical protein
MPQSIDVRSGGCAPVGLQPSHAAQAAVADARREAALAREEAEQLKQAADLHRIASHRIASHRIASHRIGASDRHRVLARDGGLRSGTI